MRNTTEWMKHNAKTSTGMRRHGKKSCERALTLAVLATLLAGPIPALAANAEGETKEINADTQDTYIYGGVSEDGSALNNSLSITGGTITMKKDDDKGYPEIAGGYGKQGDANGNTLSVSGDASISGHSLDIYGGNADTGDANQNKVIFSSSGFMWCNILYGGYAEKGAANENAITITDGEIDADRIIGGKSNLRAGGANKNSIVITGGSVDVSDIIGGYVTYWRDAETSENTISISGGQIRANDIIGGGTYYYYDGPERANRNQILITGDAELTMDEGSIQGGYGNEANNNKVILDTSKSVAGVVRVVGGQGDKEAKGNLVSINNSEVRGFEFEPDDGDYGKDFMTGGLSEDGDEDSGIVTDNKVSITGTSTVTISGISGGASETLAGKNSVFIDDQSKVSAVGIAGGMVHDDAKDGEARENSLVINGQSQVSALGITGGLSMSRDGIANNNTVSIDTPATVKTVLMAGGTGQAASDNLVHISGDVTAHLIGGGAAIKLSSRDSEKEVLSSNNVVNLANAKLASIKLDDSLLERYEDNYRYGEYVEKLKYLKGVGETTQVAGGVLLAGNKAENNHVNLSGSMDLSNVNLYGWVRGAMLLTDPEPASQGLPPLGLSHSGNTLNVGYVAASTKAGDGKASEWRGSSVQGIYNFDTIAFHAVDIAKPALTVTDKLSLPKDVNLDLDDFTPTGTVMKDAVLIDASQVKNPKNLDKLFDSGKDKYKQKKTWSFANGGIEVTGQEKLNLSADNVLSYGLDSLDSITYHTIDWETDGTALTLGKDFDLAKTEIHTEDIGFTEDSLRAITKAGDYSMTLLDTKGNDTLLADNLTMKQGKWNISNALEGTGQASLDQNGNVIYTMDTVATEDGTSIKVDSAKQTHNALMANEAGLGMLAAGRDRMEGVLAGFDGQEGGVFTFASVGGSKDTYDTGSESTAYTWNGLVGIGNEAVLPDGGLSYGLFYEYGRGHYDVDGAGYAGTGDAHYNGGGLMAKYTAKNKNYVEGSLHFGQLKNNADSVLHGKAGDAYGYRTSSNYWSGHVGFGHVFDLTNDTASTSLGGTPRATRDLDVYGKYFYTHLGGDSFRAGEADYRLDSLNSSLLRLGARMNHRSGWNNYYYGLAWDYEFDGESNGTVAAAGLSAKIRKADIGGSSLMAEAGWKLEANKDNPWEVSLSTQAYAGQHKGIGGNVYMAYHF